MKSHVANGDYADALQALAQVRAEVDRFFDEVMVNVDEPLIRANRLGLLKSLYDQLNAVADIRDWRSDPEHLAMPVKKSSSSTATASSISTPTSSSSRRRVGSRSRAAWSDRAAQPGRLPRRRGDQPVRRRAPVVHGHLNAIHDKMQAVAAVGGVSMRCSTARMPLIRNAIAASRSRACFSASPAATTST